MKISVTWYMPMKYYTQIKQLSGVNVPLKFIRFATRDPTIQTEEFLSKKRRDMLSMPMRQFSTKNQTKRP